MHHEALTEAAAALFPKLKQFSGFYLAGGTALALQIGHRLSVDFDLFCPDDIGKNLLAKVKSVFSDSKKTVTPLVNNPDELTVLVGDVKTTFLRYPFPVLNAFSDLDGIAALAVPELAATKAYTIGRRGSLKDYIDLFYVLSGNYASFEQIIELAEKKYTNEFNSRIFLEQLLYLDDVEAIDITFLKAPVDKKRIEEFFVQAVKKIRL